MVGTKTHFKAEQAPCGRTVPGDHYEDRDDFGLLMRDEFYDCGCRRIHHEYHDGSTEVEVIRHDHKPYLPEVGPDHGC